MSNEVQNPDTADQMSDTPMESPEKGKGKIPIVAHHPMEHDAMDDDDSSEEDEEVDGEADGDVEEPDEDNMEEIDMDNIVGTRTRGKEIDYAQAAKDLPAEEDDGDDDDDDDFEDDDDRMED